MSIVDQQGLDLELIDYMQSVPDETCHLCDAPIIKGKDYMDHILCESWEGCKTGCFGYTYAYGNTESAVGPWTWIYTYRDEHPQDDSGKLLALIEPISKNHEFRFYWQSLKNAQWNDDSIMLSIAEWLNENGHIELSHWFRNVPPGIRPLGERK